MNEIHSCKQGIDPECGRLCSQDNLTHLMTRLALVEGDILERLEKNKYLALRELMEGLKWEPCVISMAVGSLMRQGIVKCREYHQIVFLEYLDPN